MDAKTKDNQNKWNALVRQGVPCTRPIENLTKTKARKQLDVHGSWRDGCWGSQWPQSELWQAKGYPLWQPFEDGYQVQTAEPNWNFENAAGEIVSSPSPQEYRHTMSTLINGLLDRGFELLRFDEHRGGDYHSQPGTWDHYVACAPPWLYLWLRKAAVEKV